jgi:hypothetical protein
VVEDAVLKTVGSKGLARSNRVYSVPVKRSSVEGNIGRGCPDH